MVSVAVCKLLVIVAEGLRDRRPELSLRLCRVVRRALSTRHSKGADTVRAAAGVLEAFALGALGDTPGSLRTNDYVIDTFRKSTDDDTRSHVAWAMVNKGFDLISLDRFDEAITLYKDLAGYVPQRPPFREPLAQGFMNWGMALDHMGRPSEEIEIYDRIANSLKPLSVDGPEAHFLAWALLNKGMTLESQGQVDKAVELYDSVLNRWWIQSDSSLPPKIREAVAAALRHRANAMAAIRQYQVAIADVDRLMDRYLGAPDNGISDEVAWAMLTKAASLEVLERRTEAKETYDALVTRYGRSSAHEVREAVAVAKRRREGLE